MMKRTFPILAVMMLVAATAALLAAPRATLTLRNGDRIQCQLIDLGGVGYTIKTTGDDETLPANDVALIEFAGGTIPQAQIAKMQEGRPFIALRNGDLIDGRLTDIGGTDPLRLTVRTSSGNQDFSSSDVARIFLAKWEGMPSGSGNNPGGQSGQVVNTTVPANQCWTRTGIRVDPGQRVTFEATGEIHLSVDVEDQAGVAGSTKGRYAPRAPIPANLAGALIGRIGDTGRPFGIGDQKQGLPMPAQGELWLGINDDYCQDNRGEFKVKIDTRR